ncbi:IS66 family insertion sequence element accessory protein TnpB, partial [Pseudomonas putida]
VASWLAGSRKKSGAQHRASGGRLECGDDGSLTIQSAYLIPDAVLPISFWSLPTMMRPDAKVEKVYLYPKPVDFRKSIDGLAALVELDIKVAVFDPVLFVFLNKPRNRVKILYWERNGFCLWLKRLESERFRTSPDITDEAIVLTVQELNWLLDGFDLWRNRPHQVLTPRFVA